MGVTFNLKTVTIFNQYYILPIIEHKKSVISFKIKRTSITIL